MLKRGVHPGEDELSAIYARLLRGLRTMSIHIGSVIHRRLVSTIGSEPALPDKCRLLADNYDNAPTKSSSFGPPGRS